MRIDTSRSLAKAVAAPIAAAALLAGAAGAALAEKHVGEGMKSVATATVRAEVVAIDRTDRHITLKGPRGNMVEVEAGEEVRNFDQINVGDEVTVQYLESLAVYIGEPGFLPEDKGGAMASRAAEGDKPGVMVGGTIDVAASVLVIDRKRREVTFMLSDGTTTKTTVDPSVEMFDDLELGDTVHARITRAVAISVDAPRK